MKFFIHLKSRREVAEAQQIWMKPISKVHHSFELLMRHHLLNDVMPTCIQPGQSNVTSVTQKNVPSTVVIYYCAWYVFLRNRRYNPTTILLPIFWVYDVGLHPFKRPVKDTKLYTYHIFSPLLYGHKREHTILWGWKCALNFSKI